MRRAELLLLFALGAWSCGTVFMWQTAIRSFAVAEHVAAAENDGVAEAATGLQASSLREIARYQASEVNRLFFRGWGWAQLPLGVAALALAWRAGSGRVSVALLAVMLAIVAFLALYAVPETVRLGRVMDFADDGAHPAVEQAFWRLHHSYTALDMVKFGLGLLVAGLVWRRAPSAT